MTFHIRWMNRERWAEQRTLDGVPADDAAWAEELRRREWIAPTKVASMPKRKALEDQPEQPEPPE
jgi:hypothetical protein